MNEKLIKAQDIVLDRLNQICGKFGFNNIMVQLYAILYLSGKPLSLNDMVEWLKISKGSASINIRLLERHGAVRKVWVRGSRKDYYEAEIDIAKVILDRVRSVVKNRLSEVDDMIGSTDRILDSVDSFDGDQGEDARVFRERLGKLRSLHSQVQSIFDLFNSGMLSDVLLDSKTKTDSRKEILSVKE